MCIDVLCSSKIIKNTVFSRFLFRKGGGEVELHGRALVCSLLDLMVEFIR